MQSRAPAKYSSSNIYFYVPVVFLIFVTFRTGIHDTFTRIILALHRTKLKFSKLGYLANFELAATTMSRKILY